MREILYRAKNAKGEWEYGVPLIGGLNGEVAYITQMHSYDHWVEAETIGQYTGLDDKNGRKIFEGDIVALNVNGYNTVCTVSWAETVAQFQLWQVRTAPKTATALNLGNYDCEVIGNIHDNPELLKGERK